MDARAAVAVEAGKPLSIETVQLEGPKAGGVLVEIKATGICHTDAFTLSGEDPESLIPAGRSRQSRAMRLPSGPKNRALAGSISSPISAPSP